MKKLILYETENHIEVLASYISSFSKLYNICIEIYSNENVKKQLTAVFSKISNLIFFSLGKKICSDPKNDEVLIITSPVNLGDLVIPPSMNVYYLVHNIHSVFFPLRHINILNFAAWLKHSFRYFIFNQKRLRKLSGFIFIDRHLKSIYGQTIAKTYKNQKQIVLPTYLPIEKQSNFSKKVVISIPGNIDSNRRDYQLLKEVFSSLKRHDLKFEFLGRKNESWKQKLIQSNNDKNELKFYDHELSYIEYYDRLSKTDCIIFLSNRHKKFAGVKERIGVSTYSAVLTDIWSSSKKAIIPNFIPVPKEFQNYVHSYRSVDDLTDIMNNLSKLNSNNSQFELAVFNYYSEIFSVESKRIWDLPTDK